MASNFTMPSFPPFDYEIDKANAGPRWNKWIARLENLFVGLKMTDDARKRALLLHLAGEKVYDIYDAEKADTEETYDATKSVLLKYFEPKKNIQMEIYTFRNYKQTQGQSLDEYVTELRRLAKTCEFANVEHEILTQVIQHCRSNRLRRRALREPDKKLDDILTLGRTLEIADQQAATMESESLSEKVNKLHIRGGARPKQTRQKQSMQAQYEPRGRGTTSRGRGNYNHFQRQTFRQYRPPKYTSYSNNYSNKCWNCGGDFPHRGPCPAKGHTCENCNKQNHFEDLCRSRKQGPAPTQFKRKPLVRTVNTEGEESAIYSSTDEEYSYSITATLNNITSGQKSPTTTIKLNGKQVQMIIDTGATVNILDETTYMKIGRPKLHNSKIKLMAYGTSKSIENIGMCQLQVESKQKFDTDTFYVVKGDHGALLSYTTASRLGLVKIINKIDTKPETSQLASAYPDVFKGIGKYKGGQVKLHIDHDVKPVAQHSRRTPFHLRPKVEAELKSLLKQDIIEAVSVNTPTPWVSPIVTPPKKNPSEIRLCVDMRQANVAIMRERHILPTVDEIIHDLNGATVFSKLDLKSGYHQLELEESSRYITTFSTHMGLFRYKRLNFGIVSASEIFQETIRKSIRKVQNAKNLSDDIIVYGKTQAEHDAALHETFEALQRNGLTVNLKKCEFNKEKISFFGVVFQKEGISPDPAKVDAIHKATQPHNVQELRSFLGMTNYSGRFIEHYATICEPLRRLTRKDIEWNWGPQQESAFNELKEKLSSETVIRYYNPRDEITIHVDASPVGLGAIMSQNEQTVAYASRSLSDVESRYSQTEREALAIVWACEHFDIFIRGAPNVDIITDHKPLERIWSKARPPLRIERWGLRLQPFKITIKYRPGKDNPADYMSRHPVVTNQRNTHEQKIAEQYVNFIATEAVPKAMTLNEIVTASKEDQTITKAIELVKSGKWHEIKEIADSDINISELNQYRSIQEELTVHNDSILMRDARIVLPFKLREKSIQIAHEGHQGLTKNKGFCKIQNLVSRTQRPSRQNDW